MPSNVKTLLEKKRDGKHFTQDEINDVEELIKNGNENITDAQRGAMLMAIAIHGLDEPEQAYVDVADPIKKAIQAQGEDLPDYIKKKQDGQTLSDTQIKQFVKDACSQKKEAHIGAMIMAMYIRGLSDEETANLTKEMTDSGKKLEWPEEWSGPIVDKHSTGGVGDKVSLVLVPALAACGVKVPMISGRGLEHTGGTLDKLESIPGFNVELDDTQMRRVLKKVGCCIVGQSDEMVKADKIFYRIRDETCTVNNDGLITGSIISKKAAESLDALVLDVKVGKAAFRKDIVSACKLAEQMVKAGESYDIKTVAMLTKMDTPLGNMIGNALEVAESIQCLHGDGPSDLTDLVVQLGGQLLYSAGKASSIKEGNKMLKDTLTNGKAIDKFCDMIKAQEVEADVAEKLCRKGYNVFEILPRSNFSTELKATKSGYIHDIEAMECASFAKELGAGRTIAGENINFGVGLVLKVVVGQEIKKGDTLVVVHHDEKELTDTQKNTLHDAFIIEPNPDMRASARVIGVVDPKI